MRGKLNELENLRNLQMENVDNGFGELVRRIEEKKE